MSKMKDMTDEQKKLHQELRERMLKHELNDAEKAQVANDLTVWRYIYGYEWDLDVAEKTMLKAFAWRKEYKPENLRLKDLKHMDKMVIFPHGLDKDGCPVQYIILKNDVIENDSDGINEKQKLLVYNYEITLPLLKEPEIYQITTVVELEGGNLSLSTVKALKGIFDELGEYYPERSRRVIVLNAGWTLNIIWTFIKAFLPQHVIDKYVFISGKSDAVKKQITQYIAEDQLALYTGKELKYDEEALKKKELDLLGSN